MNAIDSNDKQASVLAIVGGAITSTFLVAFFVTGLTGGLWCLLAYATAIVVLVGLYRSGDAKVFAIAGIAFTCLFAMVFAATAAKSAQFEDASYLSGLSLASTDNPWELNAVIGAVVTFVTAILTLICLYRLSAKRMFLAAGAIYTAMFVAVCWSTNFTGVLWAWAAAVVAAVTVMVAAFDLTASS